jgi:hypothetical protein
MHVEGSLSGVACLNLGKEEGTPIVIGLPKVSPVVIEGVLLQK